MYPLNGHGVNYSDPSVINIILKTLNLNTELQNISYISNGYWGAIFKADYRNKSYALKVELIDKKFPNLLSSLLGRERNIMRNINSKLKGLNINSFIANPIYDLPISPFQNVSSSVTRETKGTQETKGTRETIGKIYKMNINVFDFYPYPLKYCSEMIDEITSKRYFLQFLRCILQCHKTGYIHRDINDENFMFQDESFHNLVLIDFGLSKQIPLKEEKNVIEEGSRLFNSLRVEKSITPSMRDDLESIAFLTWSMISPLPWRHNLNRTKELKLSLPNCPKWIKNIILYARSLKFSEHINSDEIIKLIYE